MINKLNAAAKSMRLNILRLVARAGAEGKGAHIAPSLSMVEILAVLFIKVIRLQDVFVLSKGHGGLAYYTALREAGIITGEQLDSFEIDGSDFPGQPSKRIENGIVFSSGSLGLGLSYACGLALAAKKQCNSKKIYVLLGDGELNEGSNWEAVMLAKQQKLGNIVAIVDYNGMQSDGASKEILDLDLESIFKAFGWQTRICDGHSIDELTAAFELSEGEVPNVILAKTIKGKGVSFMEKNNIWHHNRLNDEQYQNALREVDCVGI
ncbi:MAG: thiamine pyrophosphate-dependent enzyme [Spirochaetes bacterium]|nr:thiamine pyrophosphate-dependent enzyme [Brevinematales bacterium]MCL1958967.1 thiamine pyrophosphate-dependent enzyme [Spirochaetota bacterium]